MYIDVYTYMYIYLFICSFVCLYDTGLGLKRDVADPRAAPLLHLVDALPRLRSPPRTMLLETTGKQTDNEKNITFSNVCVYLFTECSKMCNAGS